MPILYENPREVGADRIVNAVAAYERWQARGCIVVDFGTATTFDAVTAKGEYLGGVICPGITIAMEALFRSAVKLPRVEFVAAAARGRAQHRALDAVRASSSATSGWSTASASAWRRSSASRRGGRHRRPGAAHRRRVEGHRRGRRVPHARGPAHHLREEPGERRQSRARTWPPAARALPIRRSRSRSTSTRRRRCPCG